MLIILAIFSIFFGFIAKDMFIGLGSGFFSDNALFIHPLHEIMINTEFGVPTLYKILPFIFTILLTVIYIVVSEFLPSIVVNFKLSRMGYNVFSFFNQRFFIELFYNRYISGVVLKLGGQSTKILDNGSIEYVGPHGLSNGLLTISSFIERIGTRVVTTNALFILLAVTFFLALTPSALVDITTLSTMVLFSSILVHFKPKLYKGVLSNMSVMQISLVHGLLVNLRDSIQPLRVEIHFSNFPNPHSFNNSPLESSMNVFKKLSTHIFKEIKNIFFNVIFSKLTKSMGDLCNKYPMLFHYLTILNNFMENITYIYTNTLKYALIYLEKNHPFAFKIFLYLFTEYTKIISGNLESKHISLLIGVGILLKNEFYFEVLFIMFLAKFFKDYVLSNKDNILNNKVFCKYPFLYDVMILFITAIYVGSFLICMDTIYEGLFLPLINKIISCVKNIKNIVLKMMGFGGGSRNPNPSPNSNPNPNPNPSPNPGPSNPSSNTIPRESESESNRRRQNTRVEICMEAYEQMNPTDEDPESIRKFGKEIERVYTASNELTNMQIFDNLVKMAREQNKFVGEYHKRLPRLVKKDVLNNEEIQKRIREIREIRYNDSTSLQMYWERKKRDSQIEYKIFTDTFNAFEKNANFIQKNSLGGVNSSRSKEFNKQLQDLRKDFAAVFKPKHDFMKNQINQSKTLDNMMKEKNIPFKKIFDHNIL